MMTCITQVYEKMMMFYVIFHARYINIPISLNETEHMYIITAGLHMIIYMAYCLDVLLCLCSPKLWNACM
jgi:hypothetical protein